MTVKPTSASWALVTGASGGIGLEIARELARQGHPLALVARDASKLQRLAAELATALGVQTEVIAADLGAEGGVGAVVQQLQAKGIAPTVLVNNAGYGAFGEHLHAAWPQERGMIDLNVTALTALTKELLPGMAAQRHGRVLNVASTASFQPGPYMAVYYATKAYVLSYSEALAEELSGSGVTVTALCPGPTATGFIERADAANSALFKGRRLPTAAEVARYGVRAMNRGQRVAIHGWANCVMAQSVRFTPRRMVTSIVARMSRPV